MKKLINFEKSLKEPTETVFVKRTKKDFEESEAGQRLSSELEKFGVGFDASTQASINLYSIIAKDVRIGENIYDGEGKINGYRLDESSVYPD